MGQQGKAMAGMAVSALSLELCKQRLQDSGRGRALAAPREGAALNDPQYLSALENSRSEAEKLLQVLANRNPGRLGGLTVRKHLRHSLERSAEAA